MRRLVLTVLRGIPDLWNAIGIALVAFALLEGAYLGQRALRAALFGSADALESRVSGHPYADEAWYPEFLRARDATREKYDPWRGYWAYGTRSTYLTVDERGHRATPQAVPPERAARMVFLLGGSAMWGYTARDEHTVPALIAAGLAEAGLHDVTLVNLAQPGYTIAHEVAALNHELTRGRAPVLAISYSGINDIRAAHLFGEPGHAFFEGRFARLYEVEASRGFFSSLAAPGERSRLVARLAMALGLDRSWTNQPRRPHVCPALGRYFAATARSAAALAREWRFDLMVVQQPSHASTHKRLTAYEAALLEPADDAAYTRECSAAIDAAMAHSTVTYRSHAGLFDGLTEAVFLDRFGHVTEHANARIADALLRELLPRLGDQPGRAGG